MPRTWGLRVRTGALVTEPQATVSSDTEVNVFKAMHATAPNTIYYIYIIYIAPCAKNQQVDRNGCRVTDRPGESCNLLPTETVCLLLFVLGVGVGVGLRGGGGGGVEVWGRGGGGVEVWGIGVGAVGWGGG